MGAVDQHGSKIRHPFVKWVDAEKGADASADRKVVPYLGPNVDGDRPSEILGEILSAAIPSPWPQTQSQVQMQLPMLVHGDGQAL